MAREDNSGKERVTLPREQLPLAGVGRVGAPKGAALPGSLPWLCASCRRQRRGEDSIAQNTVKGSFLKAFFLSSEGTVPNHGSNPRNLVLCRAVKSLCLEKRVRKVPVCWTCTVMVMQQNHLERIQVPVSCGPFLQPLVLPWILCSSSEELQAGATPWDFAVFAELRTSLEL